MLRQCLCAALLAAPLLAWADVTLVASRDATQSTPADEIAPPTTAANAHRATPTIKLSVAMVSLATRGETVGSPLSGPMSWAWLAGGLAAIGLFIRRQRQG